MRVLLIPFTALLMFTVGCNRDGKYSDEIQTLDSLHAEVVKAEEVFENIPRDTTVKTIDKIKEDLTFVQDTYEGEMKRHLAKVLSDYRATSRIVKNFGNRYQRIEDEIERTKSQLTALKNALEAGATEDKEGNEMSEEYVNKAFTQEKKVAENLISEIYELEDRVEQTHEKYAKFRPQVVPILDSLKRTQP